MTLNDIKSALNDSSYDFLRNNEHLGSSVFILALGGSFAYGMNKESSDIDLRGISFNSKNDILLGRDFEQVVDVETDTTIYSFNKMLDLLAKSNPNAPHSVPDLQALRTYSPNGEAGYQHNFRKYEYKS